MCYFLKVTLFIRANVLLFIWTFALIKHFSGPDCYRKMPACPPLVSAPQHVAAPRSRRIYMNQKFLVLKIPFYMNKLYVQSLLYLENKSRAFVQIKKFKKKNLC